MSELFREGGDAIQCVDQVVPHAMRRSDRCPYRAAHIALPLERPVCPDHFVDYVRARNISAFDVERARCRECAAVQGGERELRKEERYGVKGAVIAVPRSRDERWCETHDANAFVLWKTKTGEKR